MKQKQNKKKTTTGGDDFENDCDGGEEVEGEG